MQCNAWKNLDKITDLNWTTRSSVCTLETSTKTWVHYELDPFDVTRNTDNDDDLYIAILSSSNTKVSAVSRKTAL